MNRQMNKEELDEYFKDLDSKQMNSMVCLEGVKIPNNCHECDTVGISDIVGLKCPCEANKEVYDYESRPEGCPLRESK